MQRASQIIGRGDPVSVVTYVKRGFCQSVTQAWYWSLGVIIAFLLSGSTIRRSGFIPCCLASNIFNDAKCRYRKANKHRSGFYERYFWQTSLIEVMFEWYNRTLLGTVHGSLVAVCECFFVCLFASFFHQGFYCKQKAETSGFYVVKNCLWIE